MATTKRTTKKRSQQTSPRAAELVDRKLKARWEAAVARYRQARDDESSGWDERYEALGEILDSQPPYYLAGGYRDATSFLRAEAPGQDLRTVKRYVRVARHFAPADEARHGIARLDALLDYLEAAGRGAALPPAQLDLARQKIRVPEGKTTRVLAFTEATVEEIRRAQRAARGSSGRQPVTLPPIAARVKQALSKAKLGGISVGLRGGALYLGDIPLMQVPALAAALAKVKLN